MQNVERAISIALAVSAVAIAVSTVHRGITPQSNGGLDERKPEFIQEWRSIASAGIRSGRDDAKITIVEFVDFECPGCRAFHGALKELRQKFGDDLSVVYLPYPLPMHRFALAAARGAECAAAEGRFDAWSDVLFAKQDSLGLKTWESYAAEAGLVDSTNVARCARSSGDIRRVVDSRPLARLASVQGTPTVLVNGWRYYQTPPAEELEDVIQAILSGKQAFPRK